MHDNAPDLPQDGLRKDPARLAELKRHLILDSTPERAYDDITRLLADTLDVPIAMVNLLDAERDWFKSRVGMPVTESPAAGSFCEAFFNSPHDTVIVEDAALDARFAGNPHVVGEPFIRFYAAARLSVGLHTLGTLCVYDVKPHRPTPEQLQTLRVLASAAMELLARRAPPSA